MTPDQKRGDTIIIQPDDPSYDIFWKLRNPNQAALLNLRTLAGPSICVYTPFQPIEVLVSTPIRPLVFSVGGMEIEPPQKSKS